MRLRCPSCRSELQLLDKLDAVSVKCPSCGSTVDLSGQETIAYVPPKVGHLGPFQLLEHIGRGHFGDVFKANDSRLARIVAVKVPRTDDLSVSEREAFFREARTAARLRHPNIVTVHEVGSVGETTFIASEFIEGINLADLISGHKLPPRRAAEIAARVGDALHHAHEQGVIHRDLKPRNIMLDGEGEPHLLDFGLAKQTGGEFTITCEGEILGTPAYMAPEQARGNSSRADRRTDVYALGVSLYEMLTGQRPFDGHARGLIYQILHDEPDPPRKLVPETPRDLDTICVKAMSKQPGDRYAAAKEMADDLRHYLAGEPIRARRTGIVERSWRWCRKHALVALPSTVALVAIVLLILFQFSSVFGSRANPAPGEMNPPLPNIYAGHQEPPSPAFRHKVAIVTQPAGAEVVLYLLDWDTGRPDFASRMDGPALTPTEMELGSGVYLVVAHHKEGMFHEVLRTVPRFAGEKFGPFAHETWKLDDQTQVLQWPKIKLFPARLADESLVRCEGAAKFEIDRAELGAGKTRWRIPPFEIESTELSVGKYRRFERTKMEHLDRAPNLPAGWLTWNEALVYAESRGLRLPDLLEAEFLATSGGTQKYPWGNEPPPPDNWNPDRPVDAATRDRTATTPSITGLASGLLEWTATRTHEGVGSDGRPGLRFVVRGGPASLISPVVPLGRWSSVNQYTSHPALGLRCARSPRPRLNAADFISAVP